MSRKKELTFGERLFGKKKTLKERSREWQRELKNQQRQIKRQIRQIENAERKAKMKIKQTYKKTQDVDTIQPLAQGLVQTRRELMRLHKAHANIGSCANTLKMQMATRNVAQAMGATSDVMKAMNKLMNVPELQNTLRTMQHEMYKQGVIEEMTDDAFSAMDPEDLDEQAGEEIDNVLVDILGEQFAGVGSVRATAGAGSSVMMTSQFSVCFLEVVAVGEATCALRMW